jgi:hypothetical protein
MRKPTGGGTLVWPNQGHHCSAKVVACPRLEPGTHHEDGVFGNSSEGWRSDPPGGCREPIIPLLWVKIHELLGRVPAGSTARFVKDGTLPGDGQQCRSDRRLAS